MLIIVFLQTILAASVTQERWRALEIALGLLANLACHRDVRQALLGSPTLAELVLERALWVDDTPALAEACRLLAGICLSTQVLEKESSPYLKCEQPRHRC